MPISMEKTRCHCFTPPKYRAQIQSQYLEGRSNVQTLKNVLILDKDSDPPGFIIIVGFPVLNEMRPGQGDSARFVA